MILLHNALLCTGIGLPFCFVPASSNNWQNLLENKPGPAQVGAISKDQKDFQVSSILFYSTRKSKIFRKKITYSKKWTTGALKSHNAEKLKGGPFGIFQHPFCRKTSKKCRGTLWGKIFFRKKSRSAEKNERGLARYGMLRGKTFLVQFARPNSATWCNNIL